MQHPPVVDAGPADTLTLPLDSVRLTGTASSPNGSIVAWSWTQLTGPSISTIAPSDSPSTWVKALVAGSYTFQLTATDDKGISASDTTTVLVNASPFKVLSLQPANNPYEMLLSIFHPTGFNTGDYRDSSGLTGNSFFAEYGSLEGTGWFATGLIRFDLSSIPSNATIDSAFFYLYYNPTPGPNEGDGVHSTHGMADEIILHRVLKNWSPDTTKFADMDPLISTPAVGLFPGPPGGPDAQFNVSQYVSTMVSTNSNYGFFMRTLYLSGGGIEDPGPVDQIFISSRNTTYPGKHPKLIVYYH